MSFIEDFPHTSIYDKDLGWLIRQYKELNDNYEVLKDIYNIVKEQIHDVTIAQLQEWLNTGVFDDIINKLEYVDKIPSNITSSATYMVNMLTTEQNIEIGSDSLTKLEMLYQESSEFIVATFNFLATNYWQYGNGDYYLDMLNGYRDIIQSKAKIVGLQEYNDSTYYDNDSKLINKLHPYIYKNTQLAVGKGGVKLGAAILSAFAGYNITKKEYTDDASGFKYGYIRTMINVDNKTISVYSTHITPKSEYKNLQLQELINDIRQDKTEYKIVMGDLNIDYITEYNLITPILSTGLITVNTALPTFNSSIIDYILVSPNITFKNVKTIETEASDHRILVAELEV